MRYTECRMAPAALDMLDGLDEDTVDMRPNYDGKATEPTVLPAAFPNLLVNGSQGIAVGMATNMPPHNLVEVISGVRALMDNPDMNLEELMRYIPGPDLPTGGIVIGGDAIKEAYATGRGIFKIRATATIEDVTARKKGIVVTELPYSVGPEAVMEAIKKLINEKRLQGISDVKNLTDRKKGTRMVIECKTGFNPAAVLEELYRLTPLEISFGINNVALVNQTPLTLGLKALCQHFITHRIEVTTRRTQFRLNKAEARAHILEGLVKALASIEEVVALIRKAKDTADARDKLMKKFILSEIQAMAILEMTLRRLTGLEVTKLKDELKELKATIAELKKLLADKKALRALVSTELGLTSAKLGNPRRSRLLDLAPEPGAGAASLEIADEACMVSLSSTGLIVRYPAGTFKATLGKHDAVLAAIATTTRSMIGAVTDAGRLLRGVAVEVPVMAGRNRGGPVGEFFPDLVAGEKVLALVGLNAAAAPAGLALVTANGTIKRLSVDQYPQKSGQELIGLKDGDVLVGCAELPDEERDLVMVTSDAQLLRTSAAAIRPQGRTAGGVAGMRVSEGASVIAFGAIPSAAGASNTADGEAVVVTISDANAAKTTTAGEYPAKGRGGAGVRCQTFRKGEEGLVLAWVGPSPAMVISEDGSALSLPEERGRRDAAGVKLEDKIVSVGQTRPK